MSEIDVNSLLTQMRSLAAATQSIGLPDAASTNTSGFAALLENSIEGVNQTQKRAGELAAAFETGAGDVDLAEVMISLQKADISFKAMTEVRNKLVNAYQEIMNMPV